MRLGEESLSYRCESSPLSQKDIRAAVCLDPTFLAVPISLLLEFLLLLIRSHLSFLVTYYNTNVHFKGHSYTNYVRNLQHGRNTPDADEKHAKDELHQT